MGDFVGEDEAEVAVGEAQGFALRDDAEEGDIDGREGGAEHGFVAGGGGAVDD
ncbi:MAG: hypothetical protein JWQ89_1598 [Devosia sp.]|nr:hypothetical protein [Devosia sp.]